ncbi:MAG: hypothetical protein EOP10_00545 [Proteobacteria bacterium]|nr:MAG: hypothetical protein EOP10_00545 [Pseudomonadota bacterium]
MGNKSFLRMIVCFPLFLTLSATLACRPVSETSSTKDYGDDNFKASIGAGYDSELAQKRANCIDASRYVTSGSNVSDLSYTDDATDDQINEMTSGMLRGSFNFLGIISASLQGELRGTLATTDVSSSSITRFNVVGKSIVLGERQFSGVGESAIIADDSAQFRSLCGNEYIEQIDVGAQFYIGIKYSFKNKEHKKRAHAIAKGKAFWGLIKVSKTWTAEEREVLSDIRVSVEAFQFGGDPSKLDDLKNTLNKGSCSASDVAACAASLDRLLAYGSGEFQSQLNGMALSVRPNFGPVITNIVTVPYKGQDIYFPRKETTINLSYEAPAVPLAPNLAAIRMLENWENLSNSALSRVRIMKEFVLSASDTAKVRQYELDVIMSLSTIKILREALCTPGLTDAYFADQCVQRTFGVQANFENALRPIVVGL